MKTTQNGDTVVKEKFIDANSEECSEEDAVKVYVQLSDSKGNYIHGEVIPLK